MKRLIASASVMASLFVPTIVLAQSADGTLTPATAEPRAQNPNVIVLPPVNTTFEIPVAPGPVQTVPQPWRPMLVGAFAGILSLFGVQTGVKKLRSKGSTACSCCKGTGRESSCDTCSTCNGKGTVDDQQEVNVPCKPCGESGEEPCSSCEGAFDKGNASCAACALSGKNLDGEGEPVDCGICRGEGEITMNLTRQVPCPKCQ